MKNKPTKTRRTPLCKQKCKQTHRMLGRKTFLCSSENVFLGKGVDMGIGYTDMKWHNFFEVHSGEARSIESLIASEKAKGNGRNVSVRTEVKDCHDQNFPKWNKWARKRSEWHISRAVNYLLRQFSEDPNDYYVQGFP